MTTLKSPLLILLLLLTFFSQSLAENCLSDTFSDSRVFSSCNSLSRLSAAIHWNYHPSNGTIDIAYRASQSSTGWVAWALNPTSHGMIGAQAFFAFTGSNGSMAIYLTGISSYAPVVQDGNLNFTVYSKEAEYSNGYMTIYATLELPGNSTTVNQVWEAGTSFSNGVPSGHALTGDNILSYGSIDFLSGATSSSGSSRQHRKNTHGVLSAVSWGILMPIGAITARYLKVFANPAWFYLHVACQCSAYIVGVAGWGTGLKLGSESSGVTYHSHRNIGIILFCLATVQVFALLLRPNKDHKYRIYWNAYHYLVGYAVIVLSIINIFKGFDILDPAKGWKNAYIAIIATLGGIALVLEAVTWVVVLKRKDRISTDKSSLNGANAIHSNGNMQSQNHQGV
ncbi:cytochrome b561 and DOMON domain-containing protein At5g47530-like [Dioscorea cayenensis subsp. rotundata]|uniref:Cytochrome b561 and DOMON domain-containing protein n=1 Tax=Dioscorea cayennensis subsp. rotundata TaxID=55577 RepID=A0AB40AKH1_DIOCR|nr:cytochrome b561 and DOMON domain-containing protein At5g47530-like [Dioscorea cayenensis subsp. rotundata]